MNIIPEEPEQYTEKPRPTPSLSSLLTKRQFEYYLKANTSQLYCTLRFNYNKRSINIAGKGKDLRKSLKLSTSVNQKSLVYLGLGFGILALSKLLKSLTNNS